MRKTRKNLKFCTHNNFLSALDYKKSKAVKNELTKKLASLYTRPAHRYTPFILYIVEKDVIKQFVIFHPIVSAQCDEPFSIKMEKE